MILVHARPGVWDQVRRHLPTGSQAQFCPSLRALRRQAANASVVVVDLGIKNETLLSFLEEFTANPLNPPLVALMPSELRRYVDLVAGAKVARLLLEAEIEKIGQVVQELRSRGFFQRAVERIRRSLKLPNALQRALIEAHRKELPYSSVTALAAAVGCDAATIHREVRSILLPVGPHITMKQALDWIVILRALALASTGLGWSAVGHALAISPATLARTFRRTLDCTPGQARRLPLEEIEMEYRREVFDPLVA